MSQDPALPKFEVPIADKSGVTTKNWYFFFSQLLNTITGGVTKIIAGTNVTISPTSGVGDVTINATGGGGSGTVTNIATGTGLTGGPITTTGTIALVNTAVTPGPYTNTNLTVDAQGRITAAANGSAGTVSSVALADGSSSPIFTITGSPVTGSGTLTETLSTQSANKVFAGPTTGAAAQPTFRTLVAADGGIAGFGTVVTTLTQAGGASQSYSVPASATWLQVICIGGGAGGGSGGIQAAGVSSTGGLGGGAGGTSVFTFAAQDLAPTVTVTFTNTSGGAGAAGRTTNGSTINGTDGSNVSFGDHLIAYGGKASTAGGIGNYQNGTGGGAAATSGNQSNGACSGGGGGGSISAGNVGSAGGSGGSNPGSPTNFLILVGGTAGAVDTAGGNGTNSSGQMPSSGAGGGGSASTALLPGKNGGNGGTYGGGGGGGGACKLTAVPLLSGAGGNGGPAACIIVAY